jgi:hypothetical protein
VVRPINFLRQENRVSHPALSANIVAVITGSHSHRFSKWIKFAGGMSVKLRCERETLDA